MKARIIVQPRPEILDPQGKAIRTALGRLGFGQVTDLRAGKSFELEIGTTDPVAARAQVVEMCDRLLVNPLVEVYEIELPAKEGAP